MPKCDASLMFYRSDEPHIDECGFESYSLKCRACGSSLVGIIDPADDSGFERFDFLIEGVMAVFSVITPLPP